MGTKLEKLVAGPENAKRMKHMRTVIEKAVYPFRENTEAALVAGAAMQVARILIDLYPEPIKSQLREGAAAFLQGRDVESEQDREESLRRLGFTIPRVM